MHTQAPEDVEPRDRITLTRHVINIARRMMFLVCGVNKAPIVRPLLAGLGDPDWPATWVRYAGSTELPVVKAAARIILFGQDLIKTVCAESSTRRCSAMGVVLYGSRMNLVREPNGSTNEMRAFLGQHSFGFHIGPRFTTHS